MKKQYQYILLIVLFVSALTLFLFLDSDKSITGNVVCPPGGMVGTAPLGNECCAENTCIPPDPDTGRGCSPEYTCASGLSCKFAQGMTFNGVCEKAPLVQPPPPTPAPVLGELLVDFVPFQPTQVFDQSQDVLLGSYSLNFTGSQNIQHPIINFTEFSFEFSGGVDLTVARVFINGIYYSGSLANVPPTAGKYNFDLSPYTILVSVGQTLYLDVVADVSSLPSGTQSIQYTTTISDITSSKFITKNGKTDSTIIIVKSPPQPIAQPPPTSQTQAQSTTPTSTTPTSTTTQTPQNPTTTTTTTQPPATSQIPAQSTTPTSTTPSSTTQQPSTTSSSGTQTTTAPQASPALPLAYGSLQKYRNLLPNYDLNRIIPKGAPLIMNKNKIEIDTTTPKSKTKYVVMSLILFLGLLFWIILIAYLVKNKSKKKK